MKHTKSLPSRLLSLPRLWALSLRAIAFVVIFHAASPLYAAVVDLTPLLKASTTVDLSASNSYILAAEYHVSKDTTINGNGATIDAQNGPLGATAATLTIKSCTIKGEGWGVLTATQGAKLVLGGKCKVTGNSGNTGVHLSNSTLELSDTTISQAACGVNGTGTTYITLTDVSFSGCTRSFQQTAGTLTWNRGAISQSANTAVQLGGITPFSITGVAVTQNTKGSIAFNATNGSSGAFHGVSSHGSSYGVQASGGTVTVDEDSVFSCSYPDGMGAGTGVASMSGASLVVRDTTVTGFVNGVDIQAYTPAGSAEVSDCLFVRQLATSVCTSSARFVSMTRCRVEDAVQDGIYYKNATGFVKDCVVLDSLNSGIALLNCDGVTIEDNFVQNSAHQGIVAVQGCKRIRALNNTLDGNQIANMYASGSDFYAQGNISFKAPAFDVRFHSANAVDLDSSLIFGSQQAIEIQGTSIDIALSAILNNRRGGILFYQGPDTLNMRNTELRANNCDGATDYSLFMNDGVTANVRGCRFAPQLNPAVYNDAGVKSDLTSNYWESSSGPKASGTGSGALIDWNKKDGSSLSYSPYATTPGITTKMTTTLALSSGGSLSWDSGAGVKLSLTGKTGLSSLSGQVAGVQRSTATGALAGAVSLPVDFLTGELYVIWVGQQLRAGSSTGSLVFKDTALNQNSVGLMRRNGDGTWSEQRGKWDATQHTFTYAPSDPLLLNGTFALVKGTAATAVRDWAAY